MAAITTRAGKGSALTFTELDNNFTNINNELAIALQSGFRNAIINGNFEIWQRGTSNTGYGGVTQGNALADNWTFFSARSGGSDHSVTISRQTFTAGQTDVPGDPTYFYRHAQTTAGSGYTSKIIYQYIENVRTFQSREVTLSFYAKAATGFTLPAIVAQQYFGIGGSADVNTTVASNISITTSWQKYTYTFTMPSVSGKTIIDDQSGLGILIDLPLASTFTLDLAQIQFELGPTATPFEQRPISTEQALCDRYYQRYAGVRVGSHTESNDFTTYFSYRSKMRIPPSVNAIAGSSSNLSTLEAVNISTTGFGLRLAPSATGLVQINDYIFELSAEI